MKTVSLTINGVKHQFTVEPGKVLLDLLREDLRLTGAKQSCDRKGQCGACTVIANGKAIRSCLKKVADLDGAEIITVEGLGTPANPHFIQHAFVLSGAIQCGYCTPGMIMSVKSLLDNNSNPSVPEIKKALAGNLCRCTGYKKIIEAVQLAGKFIRKETTPEKVLGSLKKGYLGVSLPRPTSMLKACGVAQFTADIELKGALELAAVHSTEAHARIKNIDSAAALKMPGVVGIVTAADIKGTNCIRGLHPDQPVLCEDFVRYLGDPIVAIAADTREHARAAAAAVKVDYEPLPALLTVKEADAPGAPQIFKQWPNECFKLIQKVGDAEKAFNESYYKIEHEFSTHIVHQASQEPENCIAYLEGEGENERLIVYGRSCWIHGHAGQLSEAIGCKVSYREPFVGGQFGIKATLSSEGIAAAAAVHFRRPVRYIPSLTESLYLTSKRHPYDMHLKLGADKDGHLTAYSNMIDGGKGAYSGAPNAITRALKMFSSAYYMPNSLAVGRLIYTNTNPSAAARGAGVPQAIFALESAIDMMAEKIGIDPLEFRVRNSLKVGQAKSTGLVAKQWPFKEVIDDIKPHYQRALKDAAAFNKNSGPVKRGVGIAAIAFGVGVSADMADLTVELDPDDGITIYAAAQDPGEGTDAMMTQIAAHVMDIPVNKIRLYSRDMDKTAPAGPAAGSRLTYMMGGALVFALEDLKKAMAEAGTKTYAGLKKAGKPTRYQGIKKMENPPYDANGLGPTFKSEVFNVQMAEVEVNTETGAAKVIKMTTTVDAGTIINPHALEGQLEGGMDQGVGYALREQYIQGKTNDWASIKFPKITDSFEMEIISRETPRLEAPLGATGIGEMTMCSTAPAITNAINNACGVRIYDLPATPEKIKAALAGK